MVDFPAPEGAEMTKRIPRRFMLSLGILHLLADTLQFRFGGDDLAGDLRGIGLRADGVALAEHLLGEEVESPALGFLGRQVLAELGEVALQPAQLLGDVRAVGIQSQLPGETLIVGGENRIDCSQPCLEGCSVFGGDLRGQLADGGDVRRENR